VIVWLIDLDNTLHDALQHIMPRIDRDMTAYVARELDVDESLASGIRERYWRRYGATLLGMIRHHATDPHDFLRATHRFPDIDRLVRRNVQLAATLRRLPGQRIVVTNAPRQYAESVLLALGIGRAIHRLIAIEDMQFAGRWEPKPSRSMLRRLAAMLRLNIRDCVVVEDSAENLAAAKQCGMRTVLVQGISWRHRQLQRPRGGAGRRIDFQIQSVLTLPRLTLNRALR
jgi:putative hydrolase of the HAD superfamily